MVKWKMGDEVKESYIEEKGLWEGSIGDLCALCIYSQGRVECPRFTNCIRQRTLFLTHEAAMKLNELEEENKSVIDKCSCEVCNCVDKATDPESLSETSPPVWGDGRTYRDLLVEAPSEKLGAMKHDSDVYEKVDLSLIPFHLLQRTFTRENSWIESMCGLLHGVLNGADLKSFDMSKMLTGILMDDECLQHLAISRGYGCQKYSRDDWEAGFSDLSRLMRAGLRHGVAYLRGGDFDEDELGPYHKGNSHLGGLMCNLMFLVCELERGKNDRPDKTSGEKS